MCVYRHFSVIVFLKWHQPVSHIRSKQVYFNILRPPQPVQLLLDPWKGFCRQEDLIFVSMVSH